MKKAMTKRLLALVLALALCTSLMLPGFAATNEIHTHTYTYGGRIERYEGGHREAGYHMVNVYYIYVCECGSRFTELTTEIPVSHPNPCPDCGWGR